MKVILFLLLSCSSLYLSGQNRNNHLIEADKQLPDTWLGSF